jgi:hypothetical protein
MARGCDRIEHSTRDAALDAPKRLVYDKHVKCRDDLSAGLKVYASPNSDNLWHVGHSRPAEASCIRALQRPRQREMSKSKCASLFITHL